MTTATTATLETVTAVTICKPKPSKYKDGNFVSVAFGFSDGTEQWVNYDEGADELSWLERGRQYQAMVAGGKLTLVRPDQPTQPTQPSPVQPVPVQVPATQPMTQEQLEAAATHVNSLAALYGHCYGQVSVQLERYNAPDAAIQSAATTLFIAATRKFSL